VAKSADWAAGITDIDAETIRSLARRMAIARTMISGSWSVQRAQHGEQPYWAIVVLAAMLGQIGLPGGGFGFGYGSNAEAGSPRSPMPVPGLPRGPNPVKASIPVARVSDMLLNPGAPYDFNGQRPIYPDIRLVYWCGGNPFHKQQDLNQFLKAWGKPDTIVIHEPWWTPAARRADIVLPCATTLERNDIGAASSDRFWFAMQQAIEPVGEARTEYDIYTALADRLGFKEAFTEGRSTEEWLRHMYDGARQQAAQKRMELPNFDQFWEEGHFEFPTPDEPPVLFASFRADPEANPLRTPSGKIEIFSETIDGFGYEDCPGHPMWLEPAEWLGCKKAETYSLHLISNQPRVRLHSQLDCGEVSAAGKIAQREPVWINPQDAATRGIGHGDIVRIYNDRGACLAGAFVTDQVRSGVVQLATGAWYDPVDRSGSGSMDKHGNPNVLTMDIGTSRLAQCCSAQTVLVQLERFDGALPDITAFNPPPSDQRTD
jgi:biotin/methionine sulfoxide reductase